MQRINLMRSKADCNQDQGTGVQTGVPDQKSVDT